MEPSPLSQVRLHFLDLDRRIRGPKVGKERKKRGKGADGLAALLRPLADKTLRCSMLYSRGRAPASCKSVLQLPN